MRLVHASARRWLHFIVVLMFAWICDVHSTEYVPVVDDPYSYVAFDQNVKDALAIFAAERGIVMDVAPDIHGRLKGRVVISSGRELFNRAAQASRSTWYYDGRQILFRQASMSSTRRIAAGHLTDNYREKLMHHLYQAGLGTELSYDTLTRDLVAQGPAEFIDAVAHAVPAPSRKSGAAVEVHRFGKR